MRSATEKSEGDLPVFIKWHEFLTWLFLATERFPKKARFTLSERLIQLGLEVMEDLVEARYTKDKWRILQRANLRLEKVRVLVRISYEQKFLSHDGYKHAMYLLHEIGSMIGGWLRQQSGAK